MPYSQVWSNAIPDGTDDADDIEVYIQEVRRDVQERMESILGADGDWVTDDPVIPAGYDLTSLKDAID